MLAIAIANAASINAIRLLTRNADNLNFAIRFSSFYAKML